MVDLQVVETFSHPLLEQLDEGNLIKKLEDAEEGKNTESRIMGLWGEAELSMVAWLKTYKEAIWLAKLQPYSEGLTIKKKTFPFDNSSMDMLPNVMEAMLDFSSRAAPELVWARNIVKAKVYGTDKVAKIQQPPEQPQQPPGQPGQPQQPPGQPGQPQQLQGPPAPLPQQVNPRTEKELRAERVSTYCNYQLRELIPNWRQDQDKLLLALPCVGTAYKEGYWDGDEEKVCSDLLHADEVVFNHEYSRFEDAPDKFIKLKLKRNEVIGYIRGTQKWDLDEDKIIREDLNDYEFIKAYTWIDMDNDGIREPYIVIFYVSSGKAIYIQANYDEDTLTLDSDNKLIRIKANICFTQYQFLPDPEGGPMGLGWGILLGESFASLNTMLRQMIDAATLQNSAANSGIVELDTSTGRGNALQDGIIEVILGQLTPVNTRGSRSLKDSVYQFPAAGPSDALYKLMDNLSEKLRSMTTAASHIEPNTNEAATLYLARLQQALKVPNSIIMRVLESAEREFKVIFNLNYKYFNDDEYNRILDNQEPARMEKDFNPKDCDIRLVADPTQGSDIERSARAEAILQEAKSQQSNVLNLRQAYIDWLETMNTPNIELLAPPPKPDPMVEMLRMEQQMEAEFKRRDQDLREGELRVKESKNALQAAKDMAELGLRDDELVAKITKTYTEALSNLVDIGMSPRQGLRLIQGEEVYLSDQVQTENLDG